VALFDDTVVFAAKVILPDVILVDLADVRLTLAETTVLLPLNVVLPVTVRVLPLFKDVLAGTAPKKFFTVADLLTGVPLGSSMTSIKSAEFVVVRLVSCDTFLSAIIQYLL
tara:strand:- start:726 stop:1058 length:333 start_codon:yes stop_codon:yes gene_type:complete